ncbi:hypothetical protein [Sandaracinus amylolyticus]|uniref:Uncharacterized protein n=1 Tax=Sandaracinus amylolyticus TaxID=927083 RepID=A0A0F6W746_9BACT|nr:hypothetical protein [Sandaracinus amylolyticus]AKF09168.1 hypothetical protein DB32_006317 [Sandaracinus amylolyticus]
MNARIKYFFVGSYVATYAFAFAGGIAAAVLGEIDRDLEIVGTVILLPALPAMIGWFGCALWWVYDAWSSIPEEHREAPLVGRVTPAVAVVLFFVPCFNAFRIFACNIGIANSINSASLTRGSREQVPVVVPVLAACLHFVPYCNLLLGPVAWAAFMWMADKARADLGRVDADAIAQVF